MFQEYVESLDRGKSGAQNLVTAEVADKSVPDALLHYAERNAIDLIVLGTHGRRGLGRMLLGSTAEEVVRLSRCPVMTVGGKAIDSLDPRIDRMLVPIDFSDFSLEALDVAKQLATALKAQMDLIHVIQPIVVPSSYGITFPPVTSPEVLERARKALEDLGGNLGAFKGNTSVEHGIPAVSAW
jgi:nucleotide-binding universal stress UspA family protein